MARDGSYNQAFASFARRENLPAALTSDEWASVPAEIRERAFFMSQVTEAEILQQFRDEADAVIRNETSVNDAEKRLHMWLQKKGYKPPEGKAGTLQDLSSLRRINVVMQTNRDMARGHAQWVSSQTAIRAFPAQRLVRLAERVEPRDWDAIWDAAKAELAGVPGVHPTEKVALVNHPIWRNISRFDQPYPPFDFGSGMGLKGVNRREAQGLGFELDPNNDPMQQPQYRSMNEGLEVTPQVSDEVLKTTLSDLLGRFGEWDGEKMIFTDPDGTRPYTAEKLAEIWARPAPAGHEVLEQKEALDAWDGGATPDPIAPRIALRKLFGRIGTSESPGDLWRAFSLTAKDAVELIRGLSARKLTIPGNVAGWDFANTPQAALSNMTPDPKGWTVILRVGKASKAVNIRALRPGKPGHVLVGGVEFNVQDFQQDPAARTILINLAEK